MMESATMSAAKSRLQSPHEVVKASSAATAATNAMLEIINDSIVATSSLVLIGSFFWVSYVPGV